MTGGNPCLPQTGRQRVERSGLCGPSCGGHVLVELAQALRHVFSGPAGLGRIDGGKFAVLCPAAGAGGT